MNKKVARLRRAKRARMKIRELEAVRLTVHRTLQHIYAQLIDPYGKVIASASTLDKAINEKIKYGGNVEAAKVVGQLIAQRGVEAGVTKVASDRSGFKYHGRVLALLAAARENGLQF